MSGLGGFGVREGLIPTEGSPTQSREPFMMRQPGQFAAGFVGEIFVDQSARSASWRRDGRRVIGIGMRLGNPQLTGRCQSGQRALLRRHRPLCTVRGRTSAATPPRSVTRQVSPA